MYSTSGSESTAGSHRTDPAESRKELVLDRADFLGGAAQGNAEPDARNHVASMAVMAMQDNRGNPLVVRNPQLDLWIGIGETLRKHAHDSVWFGIQPDGLSDDRGILIEAAFEKTPRQDDSRTCPLRIICGNKSPP